MPISKTQAAQEYSQLQTQLANPTLFSIFINNFGIAALGFIPFVGAIYDGFVMLNTGLAVGAIGTTKGISPSLPSRGFNDDSVLLDGVRLLQSRDQRGSFPRAVHLPTPLSCGIQVLSLADRGRRGSTPGGSLYRNSSCGLRNRLFGIMGYIRDRLDAIDKKHAHRLTKKNGVIVTSILLVAVVVLEIIVIQIH